MTSLPRARASALVAGAVPLKPTESLALPCEGSRGEACGEVSSGARQLSASGRAAGTSASALKANPCVCGTQSQLRALHRTQRTRNGSSPQPCCSPTQPNQRAARWPAASDLPSEGNQPHCSPAYVYTYVYMYTCIYRYVYVYTPLTCSTSQSSLLRPFAPPPPPPRLASPLATHVLPSPPLPPAPGPGRRLASPVRPPAVEPSAAAIAASRSTPLGPAASAACCAATSVRKRLAGGAGGAGVRLSAALLSSHFNAVHRGLGLPLRDLVGKPRASVAAAAANVWDALGKSL
jgi:hypothetical protein